MKSYNMVTLSTNTTLDSNLNLTTVLTKLSKEFDIFNADYFKKHGRADLEIYFTGQGQPGKFGSTAGAIPYDLLFEFIRNTTMERTFKIDQKIKWAVSLNLDTNYAGTAIEALR